MRRVDDDDVLEVGALRNVIGWPASARKGEKKHDEKKGKCIIQRVLNGKQFNISCFNFAQIVLLDINQPANLEPEIEE